MGRSKEKATEDIPEGCAKRKYKKNGRSIRGILLGTRKRLITEKINRGGLNKEKEGLIIEEFKKR